MSVHDVPTFDVSAQRNETDAIMSYLMSVRACECETFVLNVSFNRLRARTRNALDIVNAARIVL